MKMGVWLAWVSTLFTMGVWLWMLTRPPKTFHDEGGMKILLIYFPLTFVVWLLCTLTSLILMHRAKKAEPQLDVTALRKWRRIIRWLRFAGLLLSLGTLVIA